MLTLAMRKCLLKCIFRRSHTDTNPNTNRKRERRRCITCRLAMYQMKRDHSMFIYLRKITNIILRVHAKYILLAFQHGSFTKFVFFIRKKFTSLIFKCVFLAKKASIITIFANYKIFILRCQCTTEF